jgi:hypothetical protein
MGAARPRLHPSRASTIELMATNGTTPQPERRALERLALSAVLASPAFSKNPRLSSLLEYICQKYFDDDAENIKEYSIAVDIFHRPHTFDQATDSIVRVEFYRLRKKLREFYLHEGAHQEIEIRIATGRYLPEFVDRQRVDRRAKPRPVKEPETEEEEEFSAAIHERPKRASRKWVAGIGLAAAVCVIIALSFWWYRAHSARSEHSSSVGPAAPAALPSGPEVRIRCGYSKVMFKDREGKEWSGDRYFSGGTAIELPDQPIMRAREAQLFLSLREGTFSYNIPLDPGTYELHLYFAETTYSPASSLGGGENSRVFDVQLNGKPLLLQFDIASDAGANTADVKVFKDVHPGPDGHLHLNFVGWLGLPMINAIEIVPGLAHRLRPIQMVAQNNFVVDKSGNLWSPDTYVQGGQLSADRVTIADAPDPALYNGSRYGNFSYALPVDPGTYALTLYFAEKYWGTAMSNRSGPGNRVFDVQCNGIALLRNFDIAKEIGTGHALKKTFNGLHPNAQGKLIVSFVPDVNYATVDAIEVQEETP